MTPGDQPRTLSGVRPLDAPRVAVRTLGCKVNQVETEQVLATLLERGFELVDEQRADVVVINTCTVTGEADAKARKAIRHALSANPQARVVVTGCLAATEAEDVAALGDRVIVETDKAQVAVSAARAAGRDGTASTAAPSPQARAGGGFHTRAMVKIEDGCDAFCAYCVVPLARGNPRAVPVEDIVDECTSLVGAGTREIVLTGINLGRYDDRGLDLAEVVRRVAGTGIARVRLSSIEPLDLTPELIGVMASTPAVCEHLHVPLQSGDDDVLREMGRGYTTSQYAERIAGARAAIPGLAISTDVLVGFPGETDEQAGNTLEFCRSIGFDRLHVFRYSARPRTKAAGRDDQVQPQIRAVRARRMRQLDRELRAASARAVVGAERELLIERIRHDELSGTSVAEGTTREYERVHLSLATTNEAPVGSLVKVILGGTIATGAISATLAQGTNIGSVA